MSLESRNFAICLALLAGAAAYYIPELISNSDSCNGTTLLFAGLGATIALPFIFGFWHPERPWQWGLFVLAGQLIFQLIEGWGGDMNQFPLGVALYGVLSIPTVLSGIIGASLSKLFHGRTA